MIYCPKALEENHFIRQRMFMRRWRLKSLYDFFSMRRLRSRSSFSRRHRPSFTTDSSALEQLTWFQPKQCFPVGDGDCSLPFREVFFWCKIEFEGTSIRRWLSESHRGGSEANWTSQRSGTTRPKSSMKKKRMKERNIYWFWLNTVLCNLEGA